MKYRIIYIACLLLTIALSARAQKETWNWVFGKFAGLTFKPESLRSFPIRNITNNTVIGTLDDLPSTIPSSIDMSEGSFTISDKDGNLLFYSNGIKVWKADGTVLTDSGGNEVALGGGDSSAQSGIALPYPGSDNRYICIGIAQASATRKVMNYVIIQANSPTDISTIGSVQTFSDNLGVLGESMSAIKHANGEDWWIVAAGRNTTPSYLNAWLATKDGVAHSVAVKSSLGAKVNDQANGYLKFSPNGKHFVFPTYQGSVFYGDFNNSTGEFTNINSFTKDAYGAEFSPNQKYLYLTTNTSTGETTINGVYAYDFEKMINNNVTSHIKFVQYYRPGALQLDPFGRIWSSYNSANRDMVIIENPDDPYNLKVYKLESFLANGAMARFGLPSFSSSWFYRPIKGADSFCMKENQTYTFKVSEGTGEFKLSHTEWDFGDGSAAVEDKTFGEQIHSHTYNKPGTYTITIKAFLQSDGSEAYRDMLEVTVYPCMIPVNPNVHLF